MMPALVDQDVDLAEAIDDLHEQRHQFVRHRASRIEWSGPLPPRRSEISLSARQFVRITCDERNVAALPANVSCKHKTESARTACD